MQLLIIIIQEVDYERLSREFIRHRILATKFCTEGLYLNKKNITLMVCIEKEREKEIEKYERKIAVLKGSAACVKCGRMVSEDMAYCPYCGEKMEARDMEEATEEYAEKVKEKAADVAEAMADKAEETAKKIGEAAQKAAYKTEEVLEKAADKTTQAVHKAAEKTTETAHKSADKAEEAAHRSAEKAEDAADKTVEKLNED